MPKPRFSSYSKKHRKNELERLQLMRQRAKAAKEAAEQAAKEAAEQDAKAAKEAAEQDAKAAKEAAEQDAKAAKEAATAAACVDSDPEFPNWAKAEDDLVAAGCELATLFDCSTCGSTVGLGFRV
jgi:hypothetical protein